MSREYEVIEFNVIALTTCVATPNKCCAASAVGKSVCFLVQRSNPRVISSLYDISYIHNEAIMKFNNSW